MSEMTPRSTQPTIARLASTVLGLGAVALSFGLVAQGVPQGLAEALPGAREALQPVSVSAEAPDQQVVCAGPFLGFVQQETTPRGFGETTLNLLGVDPELIELSSEELLDVFAGTDAKIASPAVFATQASDTGFLAGTTSQNIDTPFARGYQASSCQQPRSESWLVAGSTTTGRQSVLVLANPGSVQAVVDLTLYGDSGPISAPGARGILVQPGEQRFFTLSGLAPDEASPVIRILSSGTPVTAALHVSLTRGLQPDGADVASSQAPASPERVIPGVWLEPEDVLGPILGVEGYSDVAPVLRLLAPDADTQAQVIVEKPVGEAITSQVSLEAGRVLDVQLAELGQGYATVRIESDQPVVAGVRQSSVSEGKTDLAWVPSAVTLDSVSSAVIPGGIEGTLQMFNPSDQPITLSYARVSDDQSSVVGQGRVELAPGAFSTRGLGDGGGNYVFETTGPVALAISLRGSGSIAHVVVTPPPAQLPAVSVYAR
ncbi:MAG: DUF5719 family protein [Pontimonas sp.]